MLSVKQDSIKYHMTQLGIEPWSPGPLANTLLIRPNQGAIIYLILNFKSLTQYKIENHNRKKNCNSKTKKEDKYLFKR